MAGGGMNTVGLGIVFSARDNASGPMGLMRRNFNNLSTSITQGATRIMAGFALVAGGAATLRAGLDTLRGAFSLARDAGQFQQTLVGIGAVTRATASEMDALRASAINAGIATQFSPQEAAEGLQSLATAGLNAGAATEVLRPVLDLATGSLGQLGVSGAAEAVVGTLNAYRMSAGEAGNVTDRLLRITQLSNFQARDFQVGLSRAAATGAVYNQSLNDVLVTMGFMRNANIEASVASTSLREAMRRVNTDQQAMRELQRIGVRAFDQQTGAARASLDVMREVAVATANMTDEERSAAVTRIFGTRGMLAFNAVRQAQVEVMRDGRRVTLQGAEAIAHMRNELENAEGTAASFSEQVLGTFAGQMVLLTGTMQTLRTVVGDTFARLFRPLVKAVTDTLNGFIQVWMAIPESTRDIIGGLVLAGGVFMTIGGAVTAAVGAVVLVIGIMGELLLVVGAVMAGIMVAMLPVIAVWGALVAAVFAARRAYEENLGGMRDFIDGVVSRIRFGWELLVALFTGANIGETLSAQMDEAANGGVMRLVFGLYSLWMRAQEVWAGVRQGFEEMWASMGPVFEGLQAAFVETGGTIATLFSTLLGGANALPTGSFREFGRAIGQAVGQGLIMIINGIAAAIRFIDRLIAIFRGLWAIIGPVFRLWMWGMRNVLPVLQAIWSILGPIMRVLQFVQTAPIRLAARGLEALGGGGAGQTAAGATVAETGRDRQRILELGRHEQERTQSQERSEEGTSRPRPAAAEAGVSGELLDTLGRIDDNLGGGERGDTRLQVRNIVQLDGQTISDVVEEVIAEREAELGQTIQS